MAVIYELTLLSGGLVTSLSTGSLTTGLIMLGIAAIHRYVIYSNLKKEKATLYEVDKLTKIKSELESAELNRKEYNEAKEKTNNITLGNSINYEFKTSEIKRKLLYLDKEEFIKLKKCINEYFSLIKNI